MVVIVDAVSGGITIIIILINIILIIVIIIFITFTTIVNILIMFYPIFPLVLLVSSPIATSIITVTSSVFITSKKKNQGKGKSGEVM